MNGTLTLRRTTANSTTTSAPSSAHAETSHPDSFSQYNAPDIPAGSRYSKESILEIYKAQQQASVSSHDDVERLYVKNWNPEQSSGSTGRGWGKGPDSRDASNGPEICWDQNGEVKPLSLEEMTEAEKAVRTIYPIF